MTISNYDKLAEPLRNNTIYHENTASLSTRIDFAWAVYTAEPNDVRIYDSDRTMAYYFLLHAFDITDNNDQTNFQLLEARIKQKTVENQSKQSKNVEYIPGKEPGYLKKVIEQQTKGIKPSRRVKKELGILSTPTSERFADYMLETPYYKNPTERAKYRVHFKNGVLMKHGRPFSTKDYISHGRTGYAAFTMSVTGEISVFRHSEKPWELMHSSMHAGKSVACAGELKTDEHGNIVAISTYSGHYKPSLYNMYRFLEYAVEQGADISKTTVDTFERPKGYQSCKEINNINALRYRTNATEIYALGRAAALSNIYSIHKAIYTYEKSFLTSLYKTKDYIQGITLTADRQRNIDELKNIIFNYKCAILSKNSQALTIFETKLTELENQNTQLSKQHGKENIGRLATQISQIRDEIKTLREKETEGPSSGSHLQHMKKIH